MFKLPQYCTHLTHYQSNAQYSPSQASTVCEPCSSWIYKRQRNQRSNSQHLLDHGKSKRVSEKYLFLFYWLCQRLCDNHNKLWRILQEMGVPDPLTCLLRNPYAGQEATVITGHRKTDWFQIGKEVHQGCTLSPCLFNFYAEYIKGWMKHKLESTLLGEISVTSDMQMTPPYSRKWRRTKEPLDEGERIVKKLA